MAQRVSINLPESGGSDGQKRRVDIGKKFRHIILLIVVLYALSWFQTTLIVDRVMATLLR